MLHAHDHILMLHAHDHISLPVTEDSKMRSNMHITGYWTIRHTLRARKHNSTDIDDTYSNSHGKRRSSTHTEHIHAQTRRRRAPMVANAPVLLSMSLAAAA